MSKELPKIKDSKFQELDGVRLVRDAVEDRLNGVGWAFRPKPETDVGIDAEIEMVNEHGEATGKLLSLQIKCGPSYLSESTKTGYIFRGDAEHLAYWLDHSLPVLLVLVDPSCRKCYWVEITAGAVERTGKGWKIEVPCHNVLGRDQRIQLAWIAQRDNLGSLVQAKIVRWLYLRFFGRIHVLDVFETPRDFHWWSELACLDGEEMVGIHLVLDRYGAFDLDEVHEALKHVHTNRDYVPKKGLYLCFVSASPRALELPQAILDMIALYPSVEIYRFHLVNEDIYEVLPNGELVDGYSRGEPMTFGRTLSDAT